MRRDSTTLWAATAATDIVRRFNQAPFALTAATTSYQQYSTTLCAENAAPAILWRIIKTLFASIAAPTIIWRDSTALFFMAIADYLHTLLEARREAFDVVDRQPTYADLYRIVEDIAKLLYAIQFDK